MGIMKINDQVTVGGQPSTEELKVYSEQGFQSVINFRVAGEEEGQLPPDEEEKLVQAQGMSYLHIPVSMQSMTPEAVDQFRQQFAKLPRPAFAHCKSGKRAGAMVMIDMACREGMTGEQTLAQAEELGFECDNPQLRQFVSQYIDQHASAGTS